MRLKKIVADLTLDREIVKGMCQDWAISIRRACGALVFDRLSHYYTFCCADSGQS